jgi:hypothetical protein
MSTPAEDFDRAMAMLTGMASETTESKKLAAAMSEMAADWFTPHYLLALRDRPRGCNWTGSGWSSNTRCSRTRSKPNGRRKSGWIPTGR